MSNQIYWLWYGTSFAVNLSKWKLECFNPWLIPLWWMMYIADLDWIEFNQIILQVYWAETAIWKRYAIFIKRSYFQQWPKFSISEIHPSSLITTGVNCKYLYHLVNELTDHEMAGIFRLSNPMQEWAFFNCRLSYSVDQDFPQLWNWLWNLDLMLSSLLSVSLECFNNFRFRWNLQLLCWTDDAHSTMTCDGDFDQMDSHPNQER